MSKQILPNELAEIVVGLLVAPELLGELDDQKKHHRFMLAIGEVVAEYCGGSANWVNSGAQGEDMLSVSPNDYLPSFHCNVWSCYDPEGWDGEEVEGLDIGVLKTDKEVVALRSKIRESLNVRADDNGWIG